MIYSTAKVLHLVFMVSWFAGIFYIWRLFVYHAEATSLEIRSQFEIMEKRLYWIIIWPASILTMASGFTMFFLRIDVFKKQYWLHLKIALFLLLFIHQHFAGYFLKRLARGATYSPTLFRVMNEIPTLFLIAIAFLVVFRPF